LAPWLVKQCFTPFATPKATKPLTGEVGYGVGLESVCIDVALLKQRPIPAHAVMPQATTCTCDDPNVGGAAGGSALFKKLGPEHIQL